MKNRILLYSLLYIVSIMTTSCRVLVPDATKKETENQNFEQCMDKYREPVDFCALQTIDELGDCNLNNCNTGKILSKDNKPYICLVSESEANWVKIDINYFCNSEIPVITVPQNGT